MVYLKKIWKNPSLKRFFLLTNVTGVDYCSILFDFNIHVSQWSIGHSDPFCNRCVIIYFDTCQVILVFTVRCRKNLTNMARNMNTMYICKKNKSHKSICVQWTLCPANDWRINLNTVKQVNCLHFNMVMMKLKKLIEYFVYWPLTSGT